MRTARLAGEAAARVQQNRHFAAALVGFIGFNGLFALVYTLRSASPYVEGFWSVVCVSGWLVILGMAGGAYAFAVHYHRPFLSVTVALLALLSQIHIFYTQPALWSAHGAQGWFYYAVDAAGLAVFAYDRVLWFSDWRSRHMATVSDLTHRRTTSHHAHRAA